MPKFLQDRCEVCHEPITDLTKLPPEIQDKVYRPSEQEVGAITIHKTEDGKEPADPGFELEKPIVVDPIDFELG